METDYWAGRIISQPCADANSEVIHSILYYCTACGSRVREGWHCFFLRKTSAQQKYPCKHQKHRPVLYLVFCSRIFLLSCFYLVCSGNLGSYMKVSDREDSQTQIFTYRQGERKKGEKRVQFLDVCVVSALKDLLLDLHKPNIILGSFY